MSQFKLSFKLPEYSNKVEYGRQILFLGSCFSDEIAAKAKFHGFKVDSNPFGTVYHPIQLSKFIHDTFSNNVEERIVSRDDLFLSWDANSMIHGYSIEELQEQLKLIRKEWKNKIENADFLFVTFGTAWGYTFLQTNEMVANCHKFPASLFSKQLTEQKEIVEEWKKTIELLRSINPKLNIVFTVSPVRHIKDGLVENNRSKALLIDAFRHLEEDSNCLYFPSYEIVIDELRDYRFFKTDRVHPNEEAIQYVWTSFLNAFCLEDTIKISREVAKLRQTEAHRSLHPSSKESIQGVEHVKLKRIEFLKNNPKVLLD